jgi:hypothetical protein
MAYHPEGAQFWSLTHELGTVMASWPGSSEQTPAEGLRSVSSARGEVSGFLPTPLAFRPGSPGGQILWGDQG